MAAFVVISSNNRLHHLVDDIEQCRPLNPAIPLSLSTGKIIKEDGGYTYEYNIAGEIKSLRNAHRPGQWRSSGAFLPVCPNIFPCWKHRCWTAGSVSIRFRSSSGMTTQSCCAPTAKGCSRCMPARPPMRSCMSVFATATA